VGYTNVGKSTLMNLLAKSDVFAENKLFATLDTTVRKMTIDNLPFLLADTVGFIRKLPSDLVESFKSTLDEVREADLLVHVVDISHPDFEEQINVVEQTLNELGCTETPRLIVFNKIDAYRWTPQDDDDLTPPTRENISLDELKRTEELLMAPLRSRLNDAIATVAREQRLSLVINTDANACPFIEPTMGVDVTEAVGRLLSK
jgi:GTP-binding protein HflX